MLLAIFFPHAGEQKQETNVWMPSQTKTFSFPAAVDSNCIILAQSALVETS